MYERNQEEVERICQGLGEALCRGRKIEAIKTIRDALDFTIRDARDYVERYWQGDFVDQVRKDLVETWGLAPQEVVLETPFFRFEIKREGFFATEAMTFARDVQTLLLDHLKKHGQRA